MHWGSEYLSGCSSTGERLAGVNALTTSAYCPDFEAARTQARGREDPQGRTALVAAGRGLAARRTTALARARAAAGADGAFPFASCVPFASGAPLAGGRRERTGVLFRAAAHEAPPDDAAGSASRACWAWPAPRRLRYADRTQRPAPRHAAGARDGGEARLEGFLLAGDTSAEAWIKACCCRTSCRRRPTAGCCWRPAPRRRWRVQARGKQVCSCFGVTDDRRSRRTWRAAAGADERAPGRAAGRAAMRHQLRLLRARTQAHGARARIAAARRRPELPCTAPSFALIAEGHASPLQDNPPAMGISQYIKEIGRGKQGARPLDARAGRRPVRPGARRHRDRPGDRRLLPGHAHQGRDARGDGRLPRRHRTRACTAFPPAASPLVVLPSYNGARKLPVLTPLLALLLARGACRC